MSIKNRSRYGIERLVGSLPLHTKLAIAVFLDAAIVSFAVIFSQILVFGSIQTGILTITLICLGSVFSFFRLGIYSEVSSEADTSITLTKMIMGCSVAHLILIWDITNSDAIIFSSTSLSCILLVCYRALVRGRLKKLDKGAKNIGIYGAGSAGLILSSILSKSSHYNVCFFIDDNESLIGRGSGHVPIISQNNTQSFISKFGVTEIALAIPSLVKERKLEIIKSMMPLGVRVMTVPPLEDIVLGKSPIDELSTLTLSDLLGRKSVLPDDNLLKSAITEKDVVLVTGAGGSIGSELSFQIANLGPKKIILLDVSEHALYEIERKLFCDNNNCEIVVRIGSVCDTQLIELIHVEHEITVIFHAAAYKHVPMVEKNIIQAIKNNVLGTFGLVEFCEKFGIKKFIFISTDKAVRPTNVMGATKRLCEMILQGRNELNSEFNKTVYSMVRFGNVLGSSGSVVPLFSEQIKSGGPLSLTSKEITRYFMSIPEAVELVIQSSSLANGGDVFVLDMGEPVKIFDLAVLMVNLSGLSIKDSENPLGDIEIQITGLRPGEKLYEELLIGDNVKPTTHGKIMRAEEVFISWEEVESVIKNLEALVKNNDVASILDILSDTIEGFNRTTH
jgi:FlaA1/EpsC-like NDP-sugar epimerase